MSLSTNIGTPVTAASGATLVWTYSRGGADRGVRVAGPNFRGQFGSMVAFDQGISVRFGPSGPITDYFVTIKNVGIPTVYNLQIGDFLP